MNREMISVSGYESVCSMGASASSAWEGMVSGDFGLHSSGWKDYPFAPFYAGTLSKQMWEQIEQFQGASRSEKLLVSVISGALAKLSNPLVFEKSLFILATTKGDIEFLGTKNESPYLTDLANRTTSHFGIFKETVIVSNACISGVLALTIAMRMLQTGQFDSALVCGVDLVTPFVVSGFQSFQAMSPKPCKPFDLNRDGISLGEGAGAIVLEKTTMPGKILFCAGASTNDANHISGPSRSGDELAFAIQQALLKSNTRPEELAFINAHGTATPYNDEMESKAISSAGLSEVPLNSFKGFFGHTLGAAGIIESIICFEALKHGVIPASAGFQESGVSVPVSVLSEPLKSNKKKCLKIASGFGGGNAAIVFEYVEK